MSSDAIDDSDATGPRPVDPHRSGLGALAVAGFASIGAGAIHAAAVGVHSEHRQAALVFVAVAAFQIVWGALVLTRTSRWLALAGAAGNAALIAGWVLAKTSGISWIDGLDTVESVQFADALAAALALVSVVVSLAVVLEGRADDERRSTSPVMAGAAVAVIAALMVPGMASAGNHQHAHGDGTAAAADGHDHSHTEAPSAATGDGASGTATTVHDHSTGGGTDHPTQALAPVPYDPTKPIDLGGVAGVTPQQQARAENLVAITIIRLPQFADPKVAEARGYHSIGDGLTGTEHYVNWAYIDDDKILDPDYPESLVYQIDRATGTKTLVSAMFMLSEGYTLDKVPDVGGKLTQWHIHDNLCMSGDPKKGDLAPRVVGLTNSTGQCSFGVKLTPVPMIHVWIVPNRCGPFASLDGVAAGQIKPGEERLCDHAHGDGLL
jgi:hypothetical protein